MVTRPLSRVETRFLERARNALRNGQLDPAAAALDSVLALAPDCMEAMRMAGTVAQMRGEPARAAELFRRVLDADPRDAGAQAGLGIALFERGEFDAAAAALRRACELAPGVASAWYNLGRALKLDTQNAVAMEALQQALRLDPAHVQARITLADAQASIGEIDSAVANLRHVLKRDPRQAHAWFALANLKVVPFVREDVAQLRRALEAEVPDESRVLLGFSLAKGLEDCGDYAGAFDVLRQANMLHRKRVKWGSASHRQKMEATRDAFDAPFPPPANPELGREVILIVSVPRSGSSLVEQILASHPDIHGANEITDLPDVIHEESQRRGSSFPQWVRDATVQDWMRLGREYLARTQKWRRERPRFTDKNMVSWELLGAAMAMLPGARVVICRRDPLETCLACYRQWFAKGAEFSYDLDETADYLIAYHGLTSFWQSRYPGKIFDLSYESLLDEPETVVRRLLEFCGLPFDPACLDFHRTERVVLSAASAGQVRQPLRRDTARSALYGDRMYRLRRRLRQAGL